MSDAKPYSKAGAATAADASAGAEGREMAARPAPIEAQSAVRDEHHITVHTDRREERTNFANSIAQGRPPPPIRVFQKRDALEWICVIAIGIIAFVVSELVPPHNKIVTPGDEELSYPVVTETVSSAAGAAIGLLLPLFFIVIISEFAVRDRREMHVQFQMLIQCLAFCFLYTTLVKKYVGRPRPNFFAMCGWQPGEGCTADKAHQWEARQSFPSGHSSHAFAGLGFLTMYLLDKGYRLHQLRHCAPLSLAQFISLVPISFAAWIAVSRVYDYFHNYDDVLAGGVLGMACAYQAFGQGKKMLELDREKITLIRGEAPGETDGMLDPTSAEQEA